MADVVTPEPGGSGEPLVEVVEAVLVLMASTWLLLIMTTTRSRPRRQEALRRAIFEFVTGVGQRNI